MKMDCLKSHTVQHRNAFKEHTLTDILLLVGTAKVKSETPRLLLVYC